MGLRSRKSRQPWFGGRWDCRFHFCRRAHYFVARKLQLIVPGQTTDRFTYHVHLERPTEGQPYEVVKEVPTLQMVMARLRSKWPDLANEVIEKRARKFTGQDFPGFSNARGGDS